jgi:hypothetical protein
MAITPRKIIDSAVGIGRTAASAGAGVVRRLRGTRATGAPGDPEVESPDAATAPERVPKGRTSGAGERRTSGSPATVGAPKPGEPGGHKSASAAKPKSPVEQPAGATEPPTPGEQP